MSRILRRPMFRGGRVSSYGTGIAAPLVPGYQGGGQIGGGIIYGKPMADGRYGFADVTTGGDLLNMNQEQALKMAEAYGYTPEKTVDTEWVTSEGQKIYGPGSPHGLKPTFDLSSMGIGQQAWEGMDEYIYQDAQGDQVVKTDVFERKEAPTDEVTEYAKKHDMDVSTVKALQKEGELGHLDQTEIDIAAAAEGVDSEELVWQSDIDDNGQPLKTGKWVKKGSKKKKTIGDSEIDKLRAEIAQLRKDGMGGEGLDIDKETYLKALGGDKARGEDISTMLMSASSKLLGEGATVKSALSEFLGEEAKRPSKRKSLEETAALLAIKDHIAGKRSKESLAQLLGQLDYKAKLDKNSLGENIMKVAGPGSTPTVSNIRVGVKATYPGVVIEDVVSTEALEFEKSDEGKIFIETDTKTVYTIKDGAKKVLY